MDVMNKFSAYALAFAVCAGTTAAALAKHNFSQSNASPAAALALDGAYRDGLYLGRLTAGGGRRSNPPVGRWSNEKDRAAFDAGYRRGYDDVLASAAATQRDTEE
jgi:hypothetical protein